MLIAGTDEAGYGAVAGPIVAVTVCLECPSLDWWPIPTVADSKTLSERKREELRTSLPTWLIEHGAEVGIGVVPVEFINAEGYPRSHRKALEESVRKATRAIDVRPEILIIDGDIAISGYPWPQRCEPKADANHFVVAVASVLAKILRDDIMVSLDRQFPGYGFAQHKGYGTEEHKSNIEKKGLSVQHRSVACKTLTDKNKPRRIPAGW